MGEIRGFGIVRHYRSDASSHVLRWRKGRLAGQGRGATFWFFPLSTSIAEVPVDDREVPFLFHGRSVDFQDVTAQGVVTYRVVDPAALAERVDFTIDLGTGAHLKQPLDKIALLVNQIAQRAAWEWIGATPVREVLRDGPTRIRDEVHEALSADEGLAAMGLGIAGVSVAAVQPVPDLERALEAPTREKIQQEADEAAFARRALAVEKERAIQENELQNRIELSRREEQLIAQKGQNKRRETTEDAEAARIAATAKAERTRLDADAQAAALTAVEGARVAADRDRMETYRTVPPSVLLGLAAQALGGKLERIDHLHLSPDALGPMLASLLAAGTKRLEADATE